MTQPSDEALRRHPGAPARAANPPVSEPPGDQPHQVDRPGALAPRPPAAAEAPAVPAAVAPAHRAGPALSPVARASLVLGLLLLLAAGYWALEPLEVPTSQGPPFSCGTALSRPSDSFSDSVCGEINNRAALRVGTVGLAGLVVAAGGVFVAAGARRPANSP